MKPRRVTKRTKTEGIDVDTFKSWLQGVEDMQDVDWFPNLDQWKKIRQKIQQLEEPEELPVQVSGPNLNPQFPQFPQFPQHPAFTPTSQPMYRAPATPPTSLDVVPSDDNVGQDGTFSSSFV